MLTVLHRSACSLFRFLTQSNFPIPPFFLSILRSHVRILHILKHILSLFTKGFILFTIEMIEASIIEPACLLRTKFIHFSSFYLSHSSHHLLTFTTCLSCYFGFPQTLKHSLILFLNCYNHGLKLLSHNIH